MSTTWLVDETYVKIQGGRHYLYRGIDEHGQVLDCWLCRSPASLDGEPPHPEQLFYAGGMDAEHEVKPRPPIINPRCPDCKTGNMMHPAHVWEPCPVKMPNRELCGCTSRNKT